MPCNDVVLDVWVGAFPEYVCDPVLAVVAELAERAHCGSREVVIVTISLECLFLFHIWPWSILKAVLCEGDG